MQSTVILRTGEEVPTPIATVVFASLKNLFETDPVAFYELVEISRDPKHELFGCTGDVLRARRLIENNGQPHDVSRLVILAAADGVGMELKLVSPIRKEQNEGNRASKKIADLHDLGLYTLTRKVADIVFEYAATSYKTLGDKPFMEDRRNEEVNPYYNQTADGLYLELYYGQPLRIWTPWGQWGFGGSGGGWWDTTLPIILERLGATMYQELRRSQMGEFGPVYALYKVDEVALPKPFELDNAAYTPYDKVEAAWGELTERHKQQNRG